MADVKSDFLLKAIHSEITARDAYGELIGRIQNSEGKQLMQRLSRDEENHRIRLAARYAAIEGSEYMFDPDIDAGPDFSFLKKSTFSRTDGEEALRLAIGAEIDAVQYYSSQLDDDLCAEDRRMLKDLIRFEKGHKKKLERELKHLVKRNHWNV